MRVIIGRALKNKIKKSALIAVKNNNTNKKKTAIQSLPFEDAGSQQREQMAPVASLK